MKCFAVAVLVLLVAVPLQADEPPQQSEGIIHRALSWLGVRYRFGSSDEKKGVDCAGLVRRVFLSSGILLPRTAAAQYGYGDPVTRSQLCPGDLVFFRNTYKRGISHVGIFIGDNRFVHAASGRRKVSIDRLDAPYYLTRFAGGRRIVAEVKAIGAELTASNVSPVTAEVAIDR